MPGILIAVLVGLMLGGVAGGVSAAREKKPSHLPPWTQGLSDKYVSKVGGGGGGGGGPALFKDLIQAPVQALSTLGGIVSSAASPAVAAAGISQAGAAAAPTGATGPAYSPTNLPGVFGGMTYGPAPITSYPTPTYAPVASVAVGSTPGHL